MIVTCDGHSYDESLLTPGGWALDVGARGFKFAEQMAEHGLRVIAMEPDISATYDGPRDVHLLHAALVGNADVSWAMYAGWSDGTGNQLATERPAHAETYYSVTCLSIGPLMAARGIDRFDIVKLDCEGSEYDILWNWPRHAAVQISVEMHDFLGMRPRESYYDELFAGPLRDYDVVQHEWTPLRAENPVENFWDSLLVLKPEFR